MGLKFVCHAPHSALVSMSSEIMWNNPSFFSQNVWAFASSWTWTSYIYIYIYIYRPFQRSWWNDSCLGVKITVLILLICINPQTMAGLIPQINFCGSVPWDCGVLRRRAAGSVALERKKLRHHCCSCMSSVITTTTIMIIIIKIIIILVTINVMMIIMVRDNCHFNRRQ